MALHDRGRETGGGLPGLAVDNPRLEGEPGSAVRRVDVVEIGRGGLGPPPRKLHEVDALVTSASELNPAVDVDDAIWGVAILDRDETTAPADGLPGQLSRSWLEGVVALDHDQRPRVRNRSGKLDGVPVRTRRLGDAILTRSLPRCRWARQR